LSPTRSGGAQEENGTLAWPGGVDLAPETLYERIHTGTWPDRDVADAVMIHDGQLAFARVYQGRAREVIEMLEQSVSAYVDIDAVARGTRVRE
jgi:hypothetical protein